MERLNCPVCGGSLKQIDDTSCICSYCGNKYTGNGSDFPEDILDRTDWESSEISPELIARFFHAYETTDISDRPEYETKLKMLYSNISCGRQFVRYDRKYIDENKGSQASAAAEYLMYETLIASESASVSVQRSSVNKALKMRERIIKNRRIFLSIIITAAVIYYIGLIQFFSEKGSLSSLTDNISGTGKILFALFGIIIAPAIGLISASNDRFRELSDRMNSARKQYRSNIGAVRKADAAVKALEKQRKTVSDIVSKAYPEIFTDKNTGIHKGA